MSVEVKILQAFSRDDETGKEEFFEPDTTVSVSVEDADNWEAKGLAERVRSSSRARPAASEPTSSEE